MPRRHWCQKEFAFFSFMPTTSGQTNERTDSLVIHNHNQNQAERLNLIKISTCRICARVSPTEGEKQQLLVIFSSFLYFVILKAASPVSCFSIKVSIDHSARRDHKTKSRKFLLLLIFITGGLFCLQFLFPNPARMQNRHISFHKARVRVVLC